jgi:hypothetical protein
MLPSPFDSLNANLGDVLKLEAIHTELTGDKRGRRFDVDVLNRSGVVLAVAAWESLVEDVAAGAFDHLLQNAANPSVFPNRVLVLASTPLRDAKDDRRVWELSGDGWKAVLKGHRDSVLREFLGGFHSPRPDKVDELFERLIGLGSLSSHWEWHKNTPEQVKKKLNALIDLRGTIAHRVGPERYVVKDEVVNALDLVGRAAAVTQNRVSDFLHKQTGSRPWTPASYGSAE